MGGIKIRTYADDISILLMKLAYVVPDAAL